MANTKPLTQSVIIFDCDIQLFNSRNQFVKFLVAFRLTISTEPFCLKSRRKFKECKTTAQCIIQQRKAAICCIHHANDVDIRRNGELFIRIEKLQRHSTFIIFNKHK